MGRTGTVATRSGSERPTCSPRISQHGRLTVSPRFGRRLRFERRQRQQEPMTVHAVGLRVLDGTFGALEDGLSQHLGQRTVLRATCRVRGRSLDEVYLVEEVRGTQQIRTRSVLRPDPFNGMNGRGLPAGEFTTLDRPPGPPNVQGRGDDAGCRGSGPGVGAAPGARRVGGWIGALARTWPLTVRLNPWQTARLRDRRRRSPA